MATCSECKVFTPELFLCPSTEMVVRADSDGSMCKMGVPRCGDCPTFMPNLFNCVQAKIGSSAVGMQVRADSRKCDAFVQK